jgi:hypothetical protein
MSIVALKRKAATQYNNMSVGQSQFSINGTTRNQGYVGQTSLSRSLIHTPHKGSVAKNFDGNYTNSDIKASETCTTEDSTVVKKSALSNRGLLATKYRWARRPDPYAVVKVDSGRLANDQYSYIERLRKKTLSDISTYCPPDEAKLNGTLTQPVCSTTIKTAKGFPIFSRNKIQAGCTVSKPESTLAAVSQSKHLLGLVEKCNTLDNYKFVSPSGRTPLPI